MGWFKQFLGIEQKPLTEKEKKEQNTLGNKILAELVKTKEYNDYKIIHIDPHPDETDNSYWIIINGGRIRPDHYVRRIAEIRIYIYNTKKEIHFMQYVARDGKLYQEYKYFKKEEVDGAIEMVKKYIKDFKPEEKMIE